MYDFLRGTLVSRGDGLATTPFIVVDVHGVGYRLLTSSQSLRQLTELGQVIHVFTSLIVREDAMTLVGFATKQEREVFDLLQSASGVGVKVAIALLSDLAVPDLVMAIVSSQPKPLCSVKGVGPKLAQKLILELNEKFTKWQELAHLTTMQASWVGNGAPSYVPEASLTEAQTVLLSLGYDEPELLQAYHALSQHHGDAMTQWTSEVLLQHWLKWLATQPTTA